MKRQGLFPAFMGRRGVKLEINSLNLEFFRELLSDLEKVTGYSEDEKFPNRSRFLFRKLNINKKVLKNFVVRSSKFRKWLLQNYTE